MRREAGWVAVLAVALMSVAGLVFAQEQEPNDEKKLADPVKDLCIKAKIDTEKDVDWFVLGGQEGTKTTFTITHGADVDFDFEVFSDENSVGKAIGTASGDKVTCDVPGRCFVRVWSAKGTGPYEIAITPESNECEPNDDKEHSTVIPGLLIKGATSSDKDVDWFVLKGQEGQKPTFTITHAAEVDMDFEVFSDDKPAGKAIGTESGDKVTCDVPGKCFIRVWSAKGSGPYAITIRP